LEKVRSTATFGRSRYVLGVGLVQHDQGVRGHPVQELLQLVRVHHGASRVVRVADEDEPGAPGDRVRHGRQVVRLIPQRHRDRDRRRQAGQGGIGLEGAPRVEHLGIRLTDRLKQLLGHPDRAAAHRDVLRRDPEPLRDRVGQRGRAVVRVAVHVQGGLRDDLRH
jgi:hypothetical protein